MNAHHRPLILPSILACDFLRLGEEIVAVEAGGADALHLDVMDGHFVPNISFGIPIVEAVRRATKLPLDCHLMITDPERYVPRFAAAGANWISVHPEACDLAKALPLIREHQCLAGAAINPETPVASITEHLHLADLIMVMTVKPGFAGQKLLPECVQKISELKKIREQRGLSFRIIVDGGVTVENAPQLVTAGVDMLVAAREIFSSKNYAETITTLRGG